MNTIYEFYNIADGLEKGLLDALFHITALSEWFEKLSDDDKQFMNTCQSINDHVQYLNSITDKLRL